MSKPVNLNQARKARARADRQARGDANAARFGRTKAEKQRDKTDKDAARRHLDGHKLDK